MSGENTNGSSIWGRGSRFCNRSICSCCSWCRSATERGRAREVARLAFGHEAVTGLGVAQDVVGIAGDRVGQRAEALVDHDRPECDPRAILDRVRGADGLAHRRLFGEGDEQHLAARGIGDEADDVLGLLAHRTDLHRVEQPARRQQEGDRMARGGRVDDQHVGRSPFLERLDLAQHEDVLHPRDRGCDDFERARRDQPLGDALHAVRDEIVDERGIGCEEPCANSCVELDLVVSERGRAEHRG